MSEGRWSDLPTVTSEAQLDMFGRPAPIPRDKVERVLRRVHREWIAATPLLFVATSDSDGRCDASPKGDPPGFVKPLDDTTIAVPERAGNKRFDGYHNVLGNPHVGLIFVIPGRTDALRVNGTARLVTDGPFFDAMTVRAHRPDLALVVSVEEIFFHCPKAFVRAGAWQPESWQREAVRPSTRIPRALSRSSEQLGDIES